MCGVPATVYSSVRLVHRGLPVQDPTVREL